MRRNLKKGELMDTMDVLLGRRDDEIQTWLRKIEAADLALALAGASEEVKHVVLRNLSERARSVLTQDIRSREEAEPSHADRTRAIRTVLQHL